MEGECKKILWICYSQMRLMYNWISYQENSMQNLEGIDIWMEMRFSPSFLRSNQINQLVFELPDARRPNNGDPRVLAIALKKFVLL